MATEHGSQWALGPIRGVYGTLPERPQTDDHHREDPQPVLSGRGPTGPQAFHHQQGTPIDYTQKEVISFNLK
jgi:hypothetical protein